VHGSHWGEIWPLLQDSNEKLWKYPMPMLSMYVIIPIHKVQASNNRHEGTVLLAIQSPLVPHPWSPPATSLECLCITEKNLLSKFVIREKADRHSF
jgi:hypothetical protein